MKNISLIFFLIFFANSIAQNTQFVQLTFGRYGGQGNECTSGRGVCSFSTSDKASIGVVLTKRSESSIILQLNKSNINYEDQIAIVGKPIKEITTGEVFFIQSDDVYLNEQTLQLLGINSKYNKFSKGEYPIKSTKEQLEITIDLKTSD